jgi:hypothetical protein
LSRAGRRIVSLTGSEKGMSETGEPAFGRNNAHNSKAAPAQASGEKCQRAFPAPVTILTFVLILVWIAAFFIPSGQYMLDSSGSPIAGSFSYVTSPRDFRGRVQDLLLAPVNGMYGIRDPETGMVGPFNKGTMFGSVEVS